MMKRHVVFSSLAALALAACNYGETPLSPGISSADQPSHLIFDAAHGVGATGFYFLPPMVPKPAYSGVFDFDLAGLNPSVSICPAEVTDCGNGTAPLAAFTPSTTPAVVIAVDQYQVNWRTAGFAEGTYRIHIEAGATGSRRELGFADVKLRLTAQAAKSAGTGEYIGVKIGSTLPISFRIETGIVGSVAVAPATATIETAETQGYTATVSDLHGAALADRPVTWSWLSTPATGVVASIAASDPTDASGQSTTTLTAGASAGTATVTATSEDWFGTASLTVSPRHFAYVANDLAGTVTVIRVPQNTVVATVNVGARPWDVAVTPDGQRVYVPNHGSGSVSVIDAATNTVVATVNVGVEPGGVAITPDGAYAYVANFRTPFTVSVIATATNTVVATVPVGVNPTGVAITPDGQYAYVTNWFDGTVSVISTASRTVVATVPAGTNPRYLAFTPDGASLYITNEGDNAVRVMAPATNSLVTTIGVVGVCHVAMSPNGAEVYVARCGSNAVAVVATASNTVIATISSATFSAPNHVAFTPDGGFAYVTNRGLNTVSVINTSTRTVTSTIAVGTTPGGIAITP